jgi:outer membrane receptor for ferrienterochelin and colicin
MRINGLRITGTDEIERIEVVKGAAAIELFGEDALGGVIQIFTKKSMTRVPGS